MLNPSNIKTYFRSNDGELMADISVKEYNEIISHLVGQIKDLKAKLAKANEIVLDTTDEI